MKKIEISEKLQEEIKDYMKKNRGRIDANLAKGKFKFTYKKTKYAMEQLGYTLAFDLENLSKKEDCELSVESSKLYDYINDNDSKITFDELIDFMSDENKTYIKDDIKLLFKEIRKNGVLEFSQPFYCIK